MRKLVLVILLFQVYLSAAQELSVSVSSKKILVGEPLKITYSCRMPVNAVFRFKPEQGVLPSRKMTEGAELTTELSTVIEQIQPFVDTIITKGNQKTWKGSYTVTGWDEGSYRLEAPSILVDDSTLTFPTADLTIALVAEVKGRDIYDIEERFADLPEKENAWLKMLLNYGWILLLVMAIVIFFYLRKKKLERQAHDKVDELSLKERSLLAIDLLEKERLWEKGKLKEHYIELSFILRSYLSARYDLNLLENTTAEAQLLLSHKGLHPETIRVIGTVLDQSDMVKFARSAPQENEVLKVSQLVRQVIAETSPIEFEHAQ